MKYFSYGMNTNLAQMSRRCPKAVSLGAAVLPHYAFEFKSFATVTPKMNDECRGVLWEISEDCERSLDRLEGYPIYYGKINVWVEHNGKLIPCMTYLMYPEEELNYPSADYIDMLEKGYKAHGIDTNQIDLALRQVDEESNFWLTNKPNDSIINPSWVKPHTQEEY
jgi:gamma-glutamylcyclotransferase (GGCT)/AIG2-like uncharacterized protein YtfP